MLLILNTQNYGKNFKMSRIDSTVLIYNGPGISPVCYESMKRELEAELGKNYKIHELNSNNVTYHDEQEIKAIFIPAGKAVLIAEGIKPVSKLIKSVVLDHKNAALYASGGGAIAISGKFGQLYTDKEGPIDSGYSKESQLDLNPFETQGPYYIRSTREMKFNYTTVEVKFSPGYLKTDEKVARLFYAFGPCFKAHSAGMEGQEIARYWKKGNDAVTQLASSTVLLEAAGMKPRIFDGVIPFLGLEDVKHKEVQECLGYSEGRECLDKLTAELEESEQVRHEVIRSCLRTLKLNLNPKPIDG